METQTENTTGEVNPNDISAADIAGASSNTTTTTDNQKPAPVAKKVLKLEPSIKNVEGGYTLEQVGLKDEYKFWVVKWGNGNDTIDSDYEKFLAIYGKETIMAVFSAQLKLALRGKANFSIPDEEGETPEITALKQAEAMKKFHEEHPDGVILSQKEALEYRPGSRESTSWVSMLIKVKKLLKDGKREEAAELAAEANELMMADITGPKTA